MRRAADDPRLLQSRGFSLHYYVGRILGVGFLGQCFILTVLMAAAILVASAADHTFTLDDRNVGLLQHPAIWAFLLLQAVLPIGLRNSVQKLQRLRFRNGEVTKIDQEPSRLMIAPVERFLRLTTEQSVALASITYGLGLAAFVWNTYQNQRPGIAVPYDFWDSSNHFWGFWITRIYKLYLFGWLLPYMAMVHLAIVVVSLRLIRRARLSGKLALQPFHSDGAGGLGFAASLVSTPIIITLLVASIPTASAFEVHRALDVTPVLGLLTLVGWAVLAYVVPILFLRSDIVALKQQTIAKLAKLEHADYCRSIEGNKLNFQELRRRSEALDYLDKIRLRVKSVPNYPHLKRLISYLGLALTPSVISLAVKVYQAAGQIIVPALKQP